MKKIFYILICLGMLLTTNVFAESNFYQNKYGVSFTENEYDFISKVYFDGYQNFMTQDDYNEFVSSDIMNNYNKTIQITQNSNSRAIHETSAKILKMSSSCGSSTCTIITTLTWKREPVVKSYDLIGAFLNNTTSSGTPNNHLYYGDNVMLPVETKKVSNGISATYDLPNTSEAMNFVQSFTVEKTGKVYVSYQHAKQNISLANSRKYSFSASGYGGVFVFNEGINNYYDAMQGLSMTL